MKRFNQLQLDTGISQKDFNQLRDKVADYIQAQKISKPMRQRGIKAKKMLLDDCILLTLCYLRHYPTFENLGNIFGISESYCHKIYTRYTRILIQVEKLANNKTLINKQLSK